MPTMDFFSGREYEPDNEPVKKPSHDLPADAENEAKNDSTPSMTMDFFASEEPKAQETSGRTLGDFFAERAETRRQEQENEELSTEFPTFDLPGTDASAMPKNKEPLNGYQPLSFGFEDEEDHDEAASAFSFENAQPVNEDVEDSAPFVNHFDAEPESEAFDFGGKSDKTTNDESFDFGILEKGLDDDMKEFDFGPAEQETPKKKFDFDAPDNTAMQSTQNEFNFAALDDRPFDNDGEKETLSFNFASAPEEAPFDLGKDPFSIGSKEAADTTVAFNFASEKTDDLFQSDAPTRVTPVPAQTPAPQKPDALNGYQPLSFDFGEENAAEEKRETVSAPMQKEPAYVDRKSVV